MKPTTPQRLIRLVAVGLLLLAGAATAGEIQDRAESSGLSKQRFVVSEQTGGFSGVQQSRLMTASMTRRGKSETIPSTPSVRRVSISLGSLMVQTWT